ncbi:Stc1 domain-containing protein [Bisporella sp. PMI_857]|nr:Stc1 domain-containing protein [Bisporella sp. PMI_857]
MAPRNKYLDMTPQQRANIPIPAKFKCRDCGKFKEPQLFSNKEQKNYLQAYASNHNITGISAKLRCRACAGEQVTELQCEGQCGQWKPLDKFSKAQRTRGSKWCQECVLWKEAAEPGVVTAAPPNSEWAPDEESERVVETKSYANATYMDGDPYGYGNDSDDDDYGYASHSAATHVSGAGVSRATGASKSQTVPYHALTENFKAMSVAESSVARSGLGASISYQLHNTAGSATVRKSTDGSAIAPTLGYVPPYLRGKDYVPPHLRTSPVPAPSASGPSSIIGSTAKTESSVSNVYQSEIGSGWSAVDARRRAGVGNPLTFNAFDSAGQLHVQQRRTFGQTSATLTSDTSSIRTSAPAPASRGNWAKAVGTKTAKPSFPKSQSYTKQVYPDSDDEVDEI